MQAIWPNTFVEESNLTRNISTLRRVLESVVAGEQFIETIPKHGYRFVADVQEVGAAAQPLALLSGFMPVGGAVGLDSQYTSSARPMPNSAPPSNEKTALCWSKARGRSARLRCSRAAYSRRDKAEPKSSSPIFKT
jgi:hypothetical protein